MACGVLAPWPGIEPMAPAMEAWSLNHSTAKEVSVEITLKLKSLSVVLATSSLGTIEKIDEHIFWFLIKFVSIINKLGLRIEFKRTKLEPSF